MPLLCVKRQGGSGAGGIMMQGVAWTLIIMVQGVAWTLIIMVQGVARTLMACKGKGGTWHPI